MATNINNKPYQDGYIILIEEDQVCSICLDNDLYTYKSWVKMNNCTHQFHRHCVDLWLENHDTCPLCMKNVYMKNVYQIQYDLTNVQRACQCGGFAICFALLVFMIWFLIVELKNYYK